MVNDKLAKARVEIERLMSNHDCALDYEAALEDVLNIIDSTQEDPLSEGKDIFNNCLKSEEKFILPQKISGNINCENCLYSSACALGDIQACIIDKPVSEELEDAAVEWFNSIKYKSDLSGTPINAFKAGAKWQKEQMAAKAIDGVVTFDYYDSGDKTYGCVAHDSFCLEDFGLKDRDKVKVIVIKED